MRLEAVALDDDTQSPMRQIDSTDCLTAGADPDLWLEAEDAWVAHNAEVAGGTLKPSCSSWYVGANIPGKPRVFLPYMGGFPAYIDKCNAVAAGGYDGFALA